MPYLLPLFLYVALPILATQRPFKSQDADGYRNGGAEYNPFSQDVRKYAQHLLRHYHVPGLSVAVVNGDDIFTDVFEPVINQGFRGSYV